MIIFHIALLSEWQLGNFMIDYNTLTIEKIIAKGHLLFHFSDIYVCTICRKGSHTHTTSIHRFYHHWIAAYVQTMHVCIIANSSSVYIFLRLLSEPCHMSMSARIVFNWLCWLLTKSHWAVSCHTFG